MDFPDVPVRLSGGTLGGGGGCLGSGLGAQASVTSFPTTLEPWQVLQLCHAPISLSFAESVVEADHGLSEAWGLNGCC